MDLRDTNFKKKSIKKKKITELKRYSVDPNLQHYCHAFILNNKILYYKTTFIKLQLTGAARALNTIVMMKTSNAITMAIIRLMLCFAIVDRSPDLKSNLKYSKTFIIRIKPC